MLKSNEKANICRLPDGRKPSRIKHSYSSEEAISTEKVVVYPGQSPAQAFRTLVTVDRSGQHYAFVAPSPAFLSLKSTAKTVGEKSIAMLPQQDLLSLAGYMHDDCSPIGMKRFFPTAVGVNAGTFDNIIISAGKCGYQVGLSPAVLGRLIRLSYVAPTE